jgi:hypothetical protein
MTLCVSPSRSLSPLNPVVSSPLWLHKRLLSVTWILLSSRASQNLKLLEAAADSPALCIIQKKTGRQLLVLACKHSSTVFRSYSAIPSFNSLGLYFSNLALFLKSVRIENHVSLKTGHQPRLVTSSEDTAFRYCELL